MTKKVTFEFFDARVCPPEKTGEYLCVMDHGGFTSMKWYEGTQAWNVMDEDCRYNELFPVMWAEIPEELYEQDK